MTRLHRNCITDPLMQAWWREWRRSGSERPFYEYVIGRAQSIQPVAATMTYTQADPWKPANCGHSHPWGASCSVLASEA